MRVLSDDGTPLTHAELLSLLEEQGVAPGGRKREAQPFQAKLYDYLASTTPTQHAPREALAAFALEASRLGLSVSQAAAAANLAPTREVDAFAIAPSLDDDASAAAVESNGGSGSGGVVSSASAAATARGALPLIEACKALRAASDAAAEAKAKKAAAEEEEEEAAEEDAEDVDDGDDGGQQQRQRQQQ